MGADRAYVWYLRVLGLTPHVAQSGRGGHSAIDGPMSRHPGYGPSQRRRKLVEEILAWTKAVGAGDKLRYLGQARNSMWLELTAAYNLTRLSNLEAAAA